MCEVFSQWSLKLKWSTQVYKLTYYFKTNYPDPAAFEMIIYNKVLIFWEGHKNLKQYLDLSDVT